MSTPFSPASDPLYPTWLEEEFCLPTGDEAPMAYTVQQTLYELDEVERIRLWASSLGES